MGSLPRCILCFTSLILLLGFAACENGDSNPLDASNAKLIGTNTNQVIYKAGDYIYFKGSGYFLAYNNPAFYDGFYEMSGEFKINIYSEGLKSPFFPSVNILTLRETFTLTTKFTSPNGRDTTYTSMSTADRYFSQASYGTITFYGDKTFDFPSSSMIRVWSKIPYIPIESPYSVGMRQYAVYERYSESGVYYDASQTLVEIEDMEIISTNAGDFETFRMLFSDGDGNRLRFQYNYPRIGVVKFIFFQPGCSGKLEMDIYDTSIAY